MKRYTVLSADGSRLISTDLIEVAVLAMYKYAGTKLKWSDAVKSAKLFKNTTLSSIAKDAAKYDVYRIIENYHPETSIDSKEVVRIKRKAIDWEMTQVKLQVKLLKDKLVELETKYKELDYV